MWLAIIISRDRERGRKRMAIIRVFLISGRGNLALVAKNFRRFNRYMHWPPRARIPKMALVLRMIVSAARVMAQFAMSQAAIVSAYIAQFLSTPDGVSRAGRRTRPRAIAKTFELRCYKLRRGHFIENATHAMSISCLIGHTAERHHCSVGIINRPMRRCR